jgi:hypothetical protein
MDFQSMRADTLSKEAAGVNAQCAFCVLQAAQRRASTGFPLLAFEQRTQ